MATINAVLRRIEAVDSDSICVEAVKQSEETLADLNAEQINTGLKADGTEMPDYSIRSVIQYNKPAGPIRLRDTGAWQAGIYVKADSSKVSFSSSDSKNALLEGRYGSGILGLSEKYKIEAMREAVRPNFKKLMEAATGLKFK